MSYRRPTPAYYRLLSVVFLLAMGWHLVAPAVAQEVKSKPKARGGGQRFAILIGVDDYAEMQDLSYCGADQVALRQALIKAGFPDDQIFLLHDHATEQKYRPSKINIEKQLQLVLNLVERDDLLLFAFSGHGALFDGVDYLLPSEASSEDKRTLISREWVYSQLRDCRASLKVAFVDACRDDPRPLGKRSATAKEDTRKLALGLERAPEGLLLFTSCAPGETSMEEKEFGHGVFMHYVLLGMQGKADEDNNHAVTLAELHKYAARETKKYVARKFNGYQTPRKSSTEADAEVEDFAIVKLDVAIAKSDLGVVPKASPLPMSAPLSLPPSIPKEASPPTPDPAPLPPANVKPGKVISNSIGMKLVEIPAGEFLMGTPQRDVGIGNEKPLHHVKISTAFYMGAYEITLGQFLEFYHDSGYKTDAEKEGGGSGFTGNTSFPFEKRGDFVPWNTGFPQTKEHPVVNVSWNDAQAFCAWLGRKEGKRYRLPTEAEWEYACRAGTTTKYSSGEGAESLALVANLADASLNRKSAYFSSAIERDDGFPFTAPVGSFKSNGLGLYDMHGNVWEWCEDWFDKDYYAQFSKTIAVDPIGPVSGSARVIRGGGWSYDVDYCGSTNRRSGEPAYRNYNGGFRVVMSSR